MQKKLRLQLIAAGIILLLGFSFFPKPQLIKYKSANIVSEAVYWQGFGRSGSLSDANASFVLMDEETNHLHVCYGIESDRSNCQEYVVLENKGFTGAIGWLFR